jgi:CheY-like chemotaxis protein
LNEHPDLRPPLLIAQTCYGSDSDRQQTTALGFDYHLVKPVDWTALETILHRFKQTYVSN